MRILIAGGGTAGHVYPNIAVVQAMTDMADSASRKRADFLYLGEAGSVEEGLVQRFGLPFKAIEMGGLRGKNPVQMVWNGIRLMIGLAQAYLAIRNFAPHVILVSGGYGSVPAILAGRLSKVPILVYLPDITPGLAIRRLSRWVSRVAVSFAETAPLFAEGKAIVTGYPIRREFYDVDKSAARAALELEPDAPVVMIFGGSRGAHSLNMAVAQNLAELLQESQVIHISGPGDYSEAQGRRETLPPLLKARYRLYAYLHEEMIQALASADLVVARAGASVLGEFPALGLPSVLVPYPYSGQHQQANADYMVKRGAAVCVADARLGQELLPTIVGLLRDKDRMAEMSRSAATLRRPDAARKIAAELSLLATGGCYEYLDAEE